MAWSSDEVLVAAAAGDGSVSVWESATGLRRAVLQCPQPAAVTRIMMSPDVRLFGAAVGAPASCVHVFDMQSSLLLASPAVRGSVEQLQWSADGRVLQDVNGDLFNAP
jgi:WD40 repeat protein